MMTTTRRRSASRAVLTSTGIREPRTCEVKAGHGYWMGASSSPSFVLVLGVAGDMVRYVNARTLEESRAALWIFSDLACSALDTITKRAEQNFFPGIGLRLAQAMHDRAVADLAAHGAPVNFADCDRVVYRVRGTAEVDAERVGGAMGVSGNWDSEANEVDVETDRAGKAHLIAAGLTILSERLVKACPKA